MTAPPADPLAAEHLAFAERLADAARAAILPHFRTDLAVDNKAARGFDPVTQADRGAEAAMRALIEAVYPEHGIDGEEFPIKPSRSGYTWCLDPIDGTRAFIAGLPLWGTLIGLLYDDKPVLGVMDQGFLDERYRGWPGGADAILQGRRRPLTTRSCPNLTDAVLSTTDPNLFTPAEIGAFEQVRAAARLTRFGYDCYAYAMVAFGTIDLVIESGLKRHDIAALAPILTGAGGAVTDWRGAPNCHGGQVLAVGDARLLDQALVSLRRSAT